MTRSGKGSASSLLLRHRDLLVAAVIVTAAIAWMIVGSRTHASNPTSGSLTPTLGNNIAWDGTKGVTGSVSPAANGEPTCSAADDTAINCDVFTLNVPAGAWVGKRIAVHYSWVVPTDDFDMVVRHEGNGLPGMQGDGVTCNTSCPEADPVLGTSGNGATNLTLQQEDYLIAPPNNGGTYYIRAIYYAAPGSALNDYHATATVVAGVGVAPPPSSAPIPTFDNYQPMDPTYPHRDDSPEPSIGVNWNTGNVMTMSRLQCNRTVFDDTTSPANPNTAQWFPQALPAAITGLDPILWTDSVTGRTICGELQGALGSTNGVITDDDLTTAPAALETGVTSGEDHQTIGGGPPKPGVPLPVGVVRTYPHNVYYASQAIATATVATSYDGGVTFRPAVPAYTFQQCGGLHGHIKVAPNNGTVYLPNRGCQGKVGLATSLDNGQNWTVRTIPTSTSGGSDPSVGIGSGGRLYVGYTGGDNHPHVAVSDDEGVTWRNDYDFSLAVSPNLSAAVFPQAVAGDNDRAAILFLGTTSLQPGDPVGTDNGGAGPNFSGTWYPYVATTADGGLTWNVTRADNDPLHPGVKNPAQQGVICLNGTTCPGPTTSPGTIDTRNLADFNEVTVDPRGRITAVYADGCNFDHTCLTIPDNDVSATRINNQGVARLTIIRQRGGMRLFKEFDIGSPTAPFAPFVDATSSDKGAEVLWGTPDDGGAPIREYHVYRQRTGGAEQLIKIVPAGTNTVVDPKGRLGDSYRVSAVNKIGESRKSPKGIVKPKPKFRKPTMKKVKK